ncbi:MAG: hypothetical protein RJA63_3900 [Pseudomonadota bacterium]|jgi:hypothetical protein
MNTTQPDMKAAFVRKPIDLDEVLNTSVHHREPASIDIERQQVLTVAEYDEFAEALLLDREWLRGCGGEFAPNTRRVVEVSAPGRITLFVDPSGSAYGRYVGIAI